MTIVVEETRRSCVDHNEYLCFDDLQSCMLLAEQALVVCEVASPSLYKQPYKVVKCPDLLTDGTAARTLFERDSTLVDLVKTKSY